MKRAEPILLLYLIVVGWIVRQGLSKCVAGLFSTIPLALLLIPVGGSEACATSANQGPNPIHDRLPNDANSITESERNASHGPTQDDTSNGDSGADSNPKDNHAVTTTSPSDASYAEASDREAHDPETLDAEASDTEVPAAEATDTRPDQPIHVEFPGKLDNWCSDQPESFSFFTTSREALWSLAGSDLDEVEGGFGGNLGGLAGSDAICQSIGQATGHGYRVWRAFLSASEDRQGNPVHAIERIGTGPWYNSKGDLVAADPAALVQDVNRSSSPVMTFLDECGEASPKPYDIVTGSDIEGRLATDPVSTCEDWTTTDSPEGDDTGYIRGPMGGHQVPMGNLNWLSAHPLCGCGKGWIEQVMSPNPELDWLGCGGGYGGFYCFAKSDDGDQ